MTCNAVLLIFSKKVPTIALIPIPVAKWQASAPSVPFTAVQARRQEMSDALAADLERLEIRKQAGEEFKALSGAAREAVVQDRMFPVT